MSTPREALKSALRWVANIPPYGLSDAEFDAVIQDILRIQEKRLPAKIDWLEAAQKHVSGVGTYKRAGENMADLNALLVKIQNARPSGQSGPSGSIKK